jgi:predicted kinase
MNATNVIRQTRKRWIDLFADYGARVEIAYVEPSFDLILRRNAQRSNPVPEQVVRGLAAKSEVPTWAECHSLSLSDD